MNIVKEIAHSVLSTVKDAAREVIKNSAVLIKWILFALISGLFIGYCSIRFVNALGFVTEYRETHPLMINVLPIAGVFVVALYDLMNYKNDGGTNLVISSLRTKKQIPLRMAPLIFASTTVTHAFGGSAGREGAALQLGGSLANWIARALRLNENDTKVLIMCGMSAGFSAMFGTPMAAAIFSLEVVNVGVMYYSALVPCALSSLIASLFRTKMEISPETFVIANLPSFDVIHVIVFLVLGILCAVLSILFCIMLHDTGRILKTYLKNPYVRVISTSLAIIGLTMLLGTQKYSGSGMVLIFHAFAGDVDTFSFFWKMVFTTLTLEGGFKGGEIVPSFTIGATFGCLFGLVTGICPPLCAAVGMVAVFCAVTNCPITAMLIGFELFGFRAMPFMLIGVSISYMLSGEYGLYHDQKFLSSKLETQFVEKQ